MLPDPAETMEVMRFDDFFEEVPEPIAAWALPGATKHVVKMGLVRDLAEGPISGDDDLASAIALTRVVRAEYEAFGTDDKMVILSEEEAREALRALRLVLQRQGVQFRPPWSDFSSFKAYWLAHDGYGSWQARRVMISEVFQPVLERLEASEEQSFANELVEAVSPHETLGWPGVDEYIEQLRLRFRSASTVVDYKDVGNRCVGVLEALSAKVYCPAVHCPPGKTPPPVDKTDVRIGAYIDHRLPGSSNEELRGLTKKASALAHKMKHSPRADRTTSGITADAVILLANMLRRLEDTGGT